MVIHTGVGAQESGAVVGATFSGMSCQQGRCGRWAAGAPAEGRVQCRAETWMLGCRWTCGFPSPLSAPAPSLLSMGQPLISGPSREPRMPRTQVIVSPATLSHNSKEGSEEAASPLSTQRDRWWEEAPGLPSLILKPEHGEVEATGEMTRHKRGGSLGHPGPHQVLGGPRVSYLQLEH